MKPYGVILAGGQSRRMGGGDKFFENIGGRTLLSHVIERLSSQVENLAINANGDATRFAGYDVPVFPDMTDENAGPLAGVLAGMEWAEKHGAKSIVTVAADTPFFPDNFVETLVQTSAKEKRLIAMARTQDGRHPTFALWPVSLRHDLRNALQSGTRKVIDWSDRVGCVDANFDSEIAFFNVNRPADLIKAQQIWETRR